MNAFERELQTAEGDVKGMSTGEDVAAVGGAAVLAGAGYEAYEYEKRKKAEEAAAAQLAQTDASATGVTDGTY